MPADLPAIPPALVEAAARAIVRHRFARESMWDEPFPSWDRAQSHHDPEVWREGWRIEARAVLAAALAECEIREEWGAELVIPEHKNAAMWYRDRVEALHALQTHIPLSPVTMGVLVHRIVIFTPPVDTPREDRRP